MHPSLLYDTTVREQQHRLSQEARRHEIAVSGRGAAPARRRSIGRGVASRVRRARVRSTAPVGAPVQRPAATERPAADGHALAA